MKKETKRKKWFRENKERYEKRIKKGLFLKIITKLNSEVSNEKQ